MGRRRTVRLAAVLATSLALLVGLAPRVSAHGSEDTSNKASDYVRQCIAYMVNAQEDSDMAHDKIHDAMDASDKSGVDMQDVDLAHDAFHSGDMHTTQAYLEASIGVKPHMGTVQPAKVMTDSMAAVGAEPGSTFIDQPLDGTRNLSGANVVVLIVSVLALITGALLALRNRRRHVTEA